MQADLRYELALRRSQALIAEARDARLARDARAARSARRGVASRGGSGGIAPLAGALLAAVRRMAGDRAGRTDERLPRMTECPEC